MKKKVFAILICLALFVGVLPTIVIASENYGLYVNGEQFSSEKLSIACGEGTATYDPNTSTLTLNNAVITKGDTSGENPKYGIKVIGNANLTIKLLGTNSITLENGGGIFAGGDSVNYKILGGGKLSINVRWDALYTLYGSIDILNGADIDITSKEGSGIVSYYKNKVTIDGSKVKSSSYYTALEGKELLVKNKSEVILESTADFFNAAYLGNDNGSGKIEIIDSYVKSKSYYPALFTEGDLTINGGTVDCTSTQDSAIWTWGDILIKGNAKVITDGKYAMGGSSITVEAAEVDAKNTNEQNYDALNNVPVIADGYKLKYAKAVDGQQNEIDLLPSGTQYFDSYKNVHFITVAVYTVSFAVTPAELTNVVIKLDGQKITNPVVLEAGTYALEVTADNCKTFSADITVTADAATHTQNIAMTYLPADYSKVEEAVAKVDKLNKELYKDFSAVENAVNAVARDKNITQQDQVDAMAKAIEDAIAALEYKDADYSKVEEIIAKVGKLNKEEYKDFSAVEEAVNAIIRGKNITEQAQVDAMVKAIEDAIAALQKNNSGSNSSQTGDSSSVILWSVLVLVSGAAAIVVSKKKNYNK